MGFYSRLVLPRLIDWTMQSEEAARYRRKLVPQAHGVVLELGIGSGLNLPFYTYAVQRIVGLDPSSELLRRGKVRSSRSPVPVHMVQGVAERLPIEKESIDTVVLTWALCSVSDVRQTLSEARRVLRTSGQLLFVEHGLAPEPHVACWQHRLDSFWSCVSCHLDRPVDALITAAGFRVRELDTAYLGKGPKIMTYMYTGVEIPARNTV